MGDRAIIRHVLLLYLFFSSSVHGISSSSEVDESKTSENSRSTSDDRPSYEFGSRYSGRSDSSDGTDEGQDGSSAETIVYNRFADKDDKGGKTSDNNERSSTSDDESGEPPDHVIPYSEHEESRDVPTRPNYTSPGEWAKPPPDVPIDFVPTRVYSQVRGQHTVKRVPKSEAIRVAVTPEEREAAARLKKIVKDTKINTVYTEEGYEDTAYDHAGQVRDADFHEGFAHKLREKVKDKKEAGTKKSQSLKEDDDDESEELADYDDDYVNHYVDSSIVNKIRHPGGKEKNALESQREIWKHRDVDPRDVVKDGIDKLIVDIEKEDEIAATASTYEPKIPQVSSEEENDSRTTTDPTNEGKDPNKHTVPPDVHKERKKAVGNREIIPVHEDVSDNSEANKATNNAKVSLIKPVADLTRQLEDENLDETAIDYNRMFSDYFKKKEIPITEPSQEKPASNGEKTPVALATINGRGPFVLVANQPTTVSPSFEAQTLLTTTTPETDRASPFSTSIGTFLPLESKPFFTDDPLTETETDNSTEESPTTVPNDLPPNFSQKHLSPKLQSTIVHNPFLNAVVRDTVVHSYPSKYKVLVRHLPTSTVAPPEDDESEETSTEKKPKKKIPRARKRSKYKRNRSYPWYRARPIGGSSWQNRGRYRLASDPYARSRKPEVYRDRPINRQRVKTAAYARPSETGESVSRLKKVPSPFGQDHFLAQALVQVEPPDLRPSRSSQQHDRRNARSPRRLISPRWLSRSRSSDDEGGLFGFVDDLMDLSFGGRDKRATDDFYSVGRLAKNLTRVKRGGARREHERLLGSEESEEVVDRELEVRFKKNNRNSDEDSDEKENDDNEDDRERIVEADIPSFNYVQGEDDEDDDSDNSAVNEELVDLKKYPFYYNDKLPSMSALKYITDPSRIPRKTLSGMEFYESRDKYKECEEVESNLDHVLPNEEEPAPQRDIKKNMPRLKGLGDKLDCFKAKYFDDNPFDNPLFLEKQVEDPPLPRELATENLSNKDIKYPREKDNYVNQNLVKRPEIIKPGQKNPRKIRGRRKRPQRRGKKRVMVPARNRSKFAFRRRAGPTKNYMNIRRNPKKPKSPTTESPLLLHTTPYQRQVYEDVMGNIKNLASNHKAYDITTPPSTSSLVAAASDNMKTLDTTVNFEREKDTGAPLVDLTSNTQEINNWNVQGMLPPPYRGKRVRKPLPIFRRPYHLVQPNPRSSLDHAQSGRHLQRVQVFKREVDDDLIPLEAMIATDLQEPLFKHMIRKRSVENEDDVEDDEEEVEDELLDLFNRTNPATVRNFTDDTSKMIYTLNTSSKNSKPDDLVEGYGKFTTERTTNARNRRKEPRYHDIPARNNSNNLDNEPLNVTEIVVKSGPIIVAKENNSTKYTHMVHKKNQIQRTRNPDDILKTMAITNRENTNRTGSRMKNIRQRPIPYADTTTTLPDPTKSEEYAKLKAYMNSEESIESSSAKSSEEYKSTFDDPHDSKYITRPYSPPENYEDPKYSDIGPRVNKPGFYHPPFSAYNRRSDDASMEYSPSGTSNEERHYVPTWEHEDSSESEESGSRSRLHRKLRSYEYPWERRERIDREKKRRKKSGMRGRMFSEEDEDENASSTNHHGTYVYPWERYTNKRNHWNSYFFDDDELSSESRHHPKYSSKYRNREFSRRSEDEEDSPGNNSTSSRTTIKTKSYGSNSTENYDSLRNGRNRDDLQKTDAKFLRTGRRTSSPRINNTASDNITTQSAYRRRRLSPVASTTTTVSPEVASMDPTMRRVRRIRTRVRSTTVAPAVTTLAANQRRRPRINYLGVTESPVDQKRIPVTLKTKSSESNDEKVFSSDENKKNDGAIIQRKDLSDLSKESGDEEESYGFIAPSRFAVTSANEDEGNTESNTERISRESEEEEEENEEIRALKKKFKENPASRLYFYVEKRK